MSLASLVNTLAGRVATEFNTLRGEISTALADKADTTDLDGKQDISAKGTASGYASLDASTKVPIAQLPTGTSASTVAIGNDSRLSDARTPTAHASTHHTGGSDALAAADIGAVGTSDSRLSDSRTPTGTAGGVLTGTYPNPGLSLVASAPYSVTGSGTITLDPTLGNNPYTSVSGAVALNVSTSGALNGQMLMFEISATGTTTVTINAAIALTTGMSSPFSIASGKSGFFGFRYSLSRSAWVLIAQTNSL